MIASTIYDITFGFVFGIFIIVNFVCIFRDALKNRED